MNNSALETGFTRFPNDLYQHITEAKITTREYKVMLTIIRFTHGFNRQSARLSLRFIAGNTGLDYSNAGKALKSLQKKNIIITEKGSVNSYSVNSDFSLWQAANNCDDNSYQIGNG